MYDGTSPFDGDIHPAASIRARGRIAVTFRSGPRGTYAASIGEGGGYRAKFPKGGVGCEGVIINTGGGLAGGDRLDVSLSLEKDAYATVTSQSAEKVYRADGMTSHIDALATAAAGATLVWAPQETILFDGADLKRSLSVEMAADSRLLAVETVVFGRQAMGESVTSGAFADRWRVRRGGRLIFADDVRLSGDVAGHLSAPAVGKGARAVSTLLYVSADAEGRLEDVRESLSASATELAIGAGAWNGMLVVRALSGDPALVRAAMAATFSHLTRRPVPRVWGC